MTPTDQPSFQGEKGLCLLRNIRVQRLRSLLRLAACVLLICIASSARVRAYTFISNPPTVWPDGTIPMDLQLGSSSWVLMDGNISWNTDAENALAIWNLY